MRRTPSADWLKRRAHCVALNFIDIFSSDSDIAGYEVDVMLSVDHMAEDHKFYRLLVLTFVDCGPWANHDDGLIFVT